VFLDRCLGEFLNQSAEWLPSAHGTRPIAPVAWARTAGEVGPIAGYYEEDTPWLGPAQIRHRTVRERTKWAARGMLSESTAARPLKAGDCLPKWTPTTHQRNPDVFE
jgi:hypothetical protein